MTFQTLFETHAGLSLFKQQRLAERIGESAWQADLAEQMLCFDNGVQAQVQLLGSEAEGPGTWLWAWANEQSQLPPALVEAALALRAYGERHGIVEFTEPALRLEEVDGYRLSLIAVGLLEAGSFYRGPYDGGAVFFLLPDEPDPGRLAPTGAELMAAIREVIVTYSVDHRVVLQSMMTQLGYGVTMEADVWRYTLSSGETLEVEFDTAHRISGLSLAPTGKQ